MPTQIFLSYSRKDTDFAHQVYSDLERQGFVVWFDKSDIQGGEAWRKSIVEGINNSDILLIILSPDSVDSRNVTKEVSMADERQKRILPLMYRKCTLPADLEYQLTGLQWIDFSAEQYATAMERLVAAIKGMPAPPPPKPSPQPPMPPTPQPITPGSMSLVGTWQVQIAHPMTGAVLGYGQFSFAPNGAFQGSLNTVNGGMTAQGQWQQVGAQIAMQGMHVLATMPYQTLPYGLMMQITGYTPTGFTATSTGGEYIVFQRIA